MKSSSIHIVRFKILINVEPTNDNEVRFNELCRNFGSNDTNIWFL